MAVADAGFVEGGFYCTNVREIFRSHAHFRLNHAHLQSFWRETTFPTSPTEPFLIEFSAETY